MNLPAGFTGRPIGMDEVGQAVDLYNLFAQAYLGHPTDTLEEVLAFWQTPGFNLATDTCAIFEQTGKMVGIGEFWDVVEPHTRFNFGVAIHPAYENRGIGTALLEWADRRSQAALSASPSEAKVVMQQGADARMTKCIAFLQNHGFKRVRTFNKMHIELDRKPEEPILPQDALIRPYRDESERRELIRSQWEAFQDHWGFVEEPFEKYLERWLHWAEKVPNMDPSLWFVAVQAGEIAGGCLCRPDLPEDPDMGWVNMLGVRRKFRKQGLGLAMLQNAFIEFYRRGKKRVGLGVDASSLTGAMGLYERAGMHVAEQQHTFHKVLREGVDLSTQVLRT